MSSRSLFPASADAAAAAPFVLYNSSYIRIYVDLLKTSPFHSWWAIITHRFLAIHSV